MCGIIYIERKDGKSPVRPLLKRYEEQKHRGQQGFGFVAINKNNKIIGYERSKTFEEIKDKLEKFHKAKEILFHHRLPTSTPNVPEAAHPIYVSNDILKYDYYVVHNGVIKNPTELRNKHIELGFEYNTTVEEITYLRTHKKNRNGGKKYEEKIVEKFNDSEALAIELALHNEGIIDSVRTIGSAAWVMYIVNKETHAVVASKIGRNVGNPLKIENRDEISCISSESKYKDAIDLESATTMLWNYISKERTTGEFKAPVTEYSYPTYGYTNSNTRRTYCSKHKEYEEWGESDSCYSLSGQHKSAISSTYYMCDVCDIYHSYYQKCPYSIKTREEKESDIKSYSICELCRKELATTTLDDMQVCEDCSEEFNYEPPVGTPLNLLPVVKFTPTKPEKSICPQCLMHYKDIKEKVCDKCKTDNVTEVVDKSSAELEEEYESYLLSLDINGFANEGLIATEKEEGLFPTISIEEESIMDKISMLEEDLIESSELLYEIRRCIAFLDTSATTYDDIDTEEKEYVEKVLSNVLGTEINLIVNYNFNTYMDTAEGIEERTVNDIKELKAKIKVLNKYI